MSMCGLALQKEIQRVERDEEESKLSENDSKFLRWLSGIYAVIGVL